MDDRIWWAITAFVIVGIIAIALHVYEEQK